MNLSYKQWIFPTVCLVIAWSACITAVSAGSSPATADDMERIKYVTPDFQLLPASAFSFEEGQEIYKWNCAGHLMELIPRPGGYQVTLRYDNGTVERRFFTEYSNGQPFPPSPAGCHEWAYTLSLEEVRAAEQLYGQEMTWGEFLAAVVPQELNTMDDTIRSMTFTLPYRWPTREELDLYLRVERLWTMQLSQCSLVSGVNSADEQHLLPDLSDVPVGREVLQGRGWELDIEVRDYPDSQTMAGFYQKHYPRLWNTFSAAKKAELATKPPRIGSVVISRTMDDAQAEIVRGLWGSRMTNAEYFSTVWPEMWAAIPAWYRESEWGESDYSWESSPDYVDLTWTDLPVETKPGAVPAPGGTGLSNGTASVPEGQVTRQVFPLSPLPDYPIITGPDGEGMFTQEMQQHLAALGLSTDMKKTDLVISRIGREGTNMVTLNGNTPEGTRKSWTFQQDGSGLWFDTGTRVLMNDDMRFVLVAMNAIPENSPTYIAPSSSSALNEYPGAGVESPVSGPVVVEYEDRQDVQAVPSGILVSSGTLPLQPVSAPVSGERGSAEIPPSLVIQPPAFQGVSGIPGIVSYPGSHPQYSAFL